MILRLIQLPQHSSLMKYITSAWYSNESRSDNDTDTAAKVAVKKDHPVMLSEKDRVLMHSRTAWLLFLGK